MSVIKSPRLLVIFLPLMAISVIVPMAFLLLILWQQFSYVEPPFVILGDKATLSKLHINVYMYRDNGNETWRTIFLNGKFYPADNQNVDRFWVYFNYDDKLFYHYSHDNIPRMVDDMSMADHTWKFCKTGSAVYVVNALAKCDRMEDKGWQSRFLSFEDIVSRDISEKEEYDHTVSKNEKDAYARNLRKSFFDVTKPEN